MKAQKIHLQSYPTATAASKGALLFVHGGYVNSSCWEYNFIPFFQGNGYDCFALDLSGHGRSNGRDCLDEFGLDDFAKDLAYATQKIGRQTTLIGHSMGCRVIERFLVDGKAEAAIFLSPVPTTGTISSAFQLALRYPTFFQSLNDILNGNISEEVADLMTKIYFSPDISPIEAQKYLPMVGPESARALAEMALPEFSLSVRRPKLPALVIGGVNDAVFPPSMLHFMGSSWNAEVHRVEGAGHMVMLDPQWEDVATHMLDWMGTKN
ncbi:MAG: alpha/beta hydrolase [Rhodocyclaceae bacterium]